MANPALYLPEYAESRALIIGINKYQNVSPLIQAGNDAQAVADTLIKRFGFPPGNVQLLLDASATREAIMRAFLRYADQSNVGRDDRILVFFAGHGHTVSGRRGEIGYLVPVDANIDDLASLIRWDDLTRNADLIPAKHMLFLMDACYGGLALTRTVIPPNSMRFLKDMLQRYSRQVLTAGKANEVVSDSGGTRPGHSIFTSYLLDGMDGQAAVTGGILTGYGLMAYVYEKVGNDPQSHQTPHFGFIDGDGDFILDTSALASLKSRSRSASDSEPDPDFDQFIKTPAFASPPDQEPEETGATIKRLLPSPTDRVRLDDFVSGLLRETAENLSPQKFPTSGPVTNEEFSTRVQQYEDAVAKLMTATILLARWASADQIYLLDNIFERVAELDKPGAGTVVWLRLYWYPVLTLMYAAGIAALASRNYLSLRSALLLPVYTRIPLREQDKSPVVLPTIAELTEIVDQFKKLPGMEKKYVPRSEHLYKRLQPILEDQLFLGRRYEELFDEFEMILALTFADLRDDDPRRHVWGPPGRFAWKERGRFSDKPVFTNFINRVKALGEEWAPLKVGFFRGSANRFASVADAYKQLLEQINWW